MSKWIAHIKGEAGDKSFEICVVKKDNTHGFKSYGWFDENKLLISHNGGPCHWPLEKIVWDKLVKVAEEVAEILNKEVCNNAN